MIFGQLWPFVGKSSLLGHFEVFGFRQKLNMTVKLYEIPENFREVKSFGLYHVSWYTHQLTWYKKAGNFDRFYTIFWPKNDQKLNALGLFLPVHFSDEKSRAKGSKDSTEFVSNSAITVSMLRIETVNVF